ETVHPAMVGAAQLPGAPAAPRFNELAAAVPADVVERAHRTRPVADDEERLAGDAARQVVAGLLQLIQPPDQLPGSCEDRVTLPSQSGGGSIVAALDRNA